MVKLSRTMIASAALAGLLAGTSAATQTSKLLPRFGSFFGTQDPKDQSGSSSKVKERHACKGQNSCKGKGGCKSSDNGCKGKNSCKGKGGCASDGSKMPGE